MPTKPKRKLPVAIPEEMREARYLQKVGELAAWVHSRVGSKARNYCGHVDTDHDKVDMCRDILDCALTQAEDAVAERADQTGMARRSR